jgi:hypothetical protein
MAGKTDSEIREVMGKKFLKHIYHSIVRIGAVIAHRENEHWAVAFQASEASLRIR